MRLRFLLVSPWISASVEHAPQAVHPGLMEVARYLSGCDAEIAIIDCGSQECRIPEENFAERMREAQPVDAVFISSCTTCCSGVQKAVEVVREILGDIPVILSGNCELVAVEYSGADFIFTGPVKGLSFVLSTFGFRLQKKKAGRQT
ncbi:MAG: cobalamin B12-binding domain-containing protein [Nitrospirales bacterium]|nr:cobalamin B12-binding domain-containing protein [Nitrospirales bacterium]